jgi:hypothetical protein
MQANRDPSNNSDARASGRTALHMRRFLLLRLVAVLKMTPLNSLRPKREFAMLVSYRRKFHVDENAPAM